MRKTSIRGLTGELRLINIRRLGKYTNSETRRVVNVYTGTSTRQGGDLYYFLRSGKRIFIPACKFSDWIKKE